MQEIEETFSCGNYQFIDLTFTKVYVGPTSKLKTVDNVTLDINMKRLRK